MPNTPPQLMANGDIRPSRFVKMDSSAAHKGLEADANESVIGIAFEGTNRAPLSDVTITALAAKQGQYFKMYGDGDVCLLEAGASITTGDKLKSDNDGRGTTIATSTVLQQIGAIALEDAAAAGELIRVFVKLGSERGSLV